MSLLKEVILQMFFVLIPFVLFNIYYRDKMRNFSQFFILVTSSISLFLAMTFSSSVVEGVIFDVRYVIMFFGLVYGGVQTGLILLGEFVIYRLYLGGDGSLIALVISVFSFSVSLLMYRTYKTTHRKTFFTILAGVLFSIIALTLTYFYLPHYFVKHLTYHMLVIPLQNTLGIWILMSLFSKSVSDKEIFIKHAQNEKIETMSHVAASLAHEVRNPLTAVKGFLRLMQENPHDFTKSAQYMNICMDEIQRTEVILSEYLAISKPLTNRHEQVNVVELLKVMRAVMSPFAILHNVELEVRAPDISVTIMANPDEIKQVLVNFIKNAIEACTNVRKGRVFLSLVVEEGKAILIIKDNGVGMDEGQMKRLGSIYFSTKSSGTGLGLTYSYHVIHTIGGTVTVNSKPNVGTKFSIIFPYQE
ncbi:sensor histidine kinase [Brevibacillus nitrificans]|uniref:sensor histidine kinase n=1 Tax=Brevibacillus nitrificans TaxID=651560 RepID=UPI00260BAE45|nr:HAMP domain-containing sensor histidine kinase [Brevibacillus nitrificans]MED1795923.1 HAMP domain-containing sensor histidine kinase [Brevibacillus nitrificans]